MLQLEISLKVVCNCIKIDCNCVNPTEVYMTNQNYNKIETFKKILNDRFVF